MAASAASCSARSPRPAGERTAPRGSVRRRPNAREDHLTVDEAIRDLLGVSTDVTAVAVLDEGGAVIASGPGVAGAAVAEAAAGLWEEAARVAGGAGGALEHVVVPVGAAAVAVVAACGHRAVAVTGPRPAVALLLFDLRTCLGDAYAVPEEA
jgi:hypothetical protein